MTIGAKAVTTIRETAYWALEGKEPFLTMLQ